MTTATLPIFNIKHLIIGIAMLLAAGLAVVMTPKQKVAEEGPKIDLEIMIPKQFGEWRIDESIVPVKINPEVQAKLDKIYSQTLSRTYVNHNGERIMLSIAYGGNQQDGLQVHKPEVCYPAQGFEVLEKSTSVLTLPNREIPVVRLLTRLGPRIEPITYWITVGNKVPGSGISKKMEKITLGLSGKVPDGMLVRVSNIGEKNSGFKLHERFLADLILTVSADIRLKLFGAE